MSSNVEIFLRNVIEYGGATLDFDTPGEALAFRNNCHQFRHRQQKKGVTTWNDLMFSVKDTRMYVYVGFAQNVKVRMGPPVDDIV